MSFSKAITRCQRAHSPTSFPSCYPFKETTENVHCHQLSNPLLPRVPIMAFSYKDFFFGGTTFCFCLKVRLGVAIMTVAGMLFAGLLSILLWFEVSSESASCPSPAISSRTSIVRHIDQGASCVHSWRFARNPTFRGLNSGVTTCLSILPPLNTLADL